MLHKLSNAVDKQVDVLLCFSKDNLDTGMISELSGLSDFQFKAELDETVMLYTASGQRVFLLGLGDLKSKSKLRSAFQKFAFKNRKYFRTVLQVDLRRLNDNEIVEAVTGITMANYNMGTFKTEKDRKEEVEYHFLSGKDIEKPVSEGIDSGESINNIRRLIDAPPNQKTPEYLAQYVSDSAGKYGYKCEIKDKSTLEKEGFGALLAVGAGSINEPRLIKMTYTPKAGADIDIALVGKGITFDSGGLSIKPSQNLHYLKSDMGGAAAVIGAVELVAKLKLNVNIIGIVASAENAVDAESFRPGDVIKSYSGKTIEIIDTDAEGRLVLADGLSYVIKDSKPKQVIDLATLTGSVVRTLGYSAAGMFTNNEEMANSLKTIGNSINEKVWQLPLYKEFDSDLHSDLADIRNFSGKPIAGGITAAKFLEAFTEDHNSWLHLDIAGVSFGDSDFSKMKSATGYGVRLLVEYIKTLS